MTIYLHGGKSRLKKILPQIKTGVAKTDKNCKDPYYRPDMVYFTEEYGYALFFAGLYPYGEGSIYHVKPLTALIKDPYGGGFMTEELEILREIPLSREEWDLAHYPLIKRLG